MLKSRRGLIKRAWRSRWQEHLDEPRIRLEALIDSALIDHGVMRRLYPNRKEIAPGIWRSSQPAADVIRRLARRGLRSIVNLRGEGLGGSYVFEREACAEAGVTLIDWRMNSRTLPHRESLLAFLEMLREVEKPVLMHCKSGADRAGFAAALYLLAFEDAPVATARRQLGLRYLHIRQSAAGILDAFIEAYAARQAETGIVFLDWVRDEYDPAAIAGGFRPSGAVETIARGLMRRE